MIVRLLLGVALLAILTPVPSQAAETLGRLFFNPEQRAQMDLARSKRIRTTLSEEPAEQQSASLPETVTYNGVVRRSDGKNTIWLNGRGVPEGEMAGRTPVSSKLHPDGRLIIELPQANRSIDLRVGQELEISSGSIAEPYARATPVAKPAAKPALGEKASPTTADKTPLGTRKDERPREEIRESTADNAAQKPRREREARDRNGSQER